MPATLRLLKYTPTEAILIMANNQLNIWLRPEIATVGPPAKLDDEGILTQVTITTRPSIDEGIRRDYVGEFPFRYQRLSVPEIFGNMFLDVTPPITIHGCLNNICKASGLEIDVNDFENGLIEDNNFQLVAKPESLRWAGAATVRLNDPIVEVLLADAFSDNVLDGFIPPDFGKDVLLSEYFPNQDLSGLTHQP